MFKQKLVLPVGLDLIKCLGEGWKIKEEDRSLFALTLTEIEIDNLLFETCLREGETRIAGEENFRRLKEKPDFIPLGSNACFGFWEDYMTKKQYSVLEWIYQTHQEVFDTDPKLYFFGTIFLDPSGYRSVLYLYRDDDGWHRDYNWLDLDWLVGCLSVVVQVSPDGLDSSDFWIL